MTKVPIGPHEADPHHTSTGEWACYACKTGLRGSFMHPVIPWMHKDNTSAFAVLVQGRDLEAGIEAQQTLRGQGPK